MPSGTPRKRAKLRKSAPSTTVSHQGVTQNASKSNVVTYTRTLITYLAFAILACGGAYYYIKYLMWDSPTVPDDVKLPFSVVELHGKGKGAIASRDIAAGELILREEPLFLVPSKISTTPGALLLHSLAELSPSKRHSFYNLSYVNLPADLEPDSPAYNEQLALAIFETNSIAAGNNVGIFPRTARLNHGCSSAFNSVYTWREGEGALVVFALKSIKKGEELLTTYTNTKQPRETRRRYLLDSYGFKCQCSTCSLPEKQSQESDERLTKMTELYSRLATWQHEKIDGIEAIQIAREIWGIGEQEGYWSERGRLAADASWVAAAHSDAQATQEWAQLAANWYSFELGSDSEQVKEMERTVTHPHSHVAWESQKKQKVGGPEIIL